MNSDYIVRQVDFLSKHAEAAQYFAWIWGHTLNALWKATGNPTEKESIEISFKESIPGSFEMYRLLKDGGDNGFYDLTRWACGNVIERKVSFNSSLRGIPKFLAEFFKSNGWEVSKEPIAIEV